MTTSDSRVCTAQVRQGGTCTKNIFSLAVLRISSEVGLGLPLFNALRRQKLATFLGSRTHKKWPLGLFKTNSLTTVICEFLSLFFFFRLLVLLFLFRLFFRKLVGQRKVKRPILGNQMTRSVNGTVVNLQLHTCVGLCHTISQ